MTKEMRVERDALKTSGGAFKDGAQAVRQLASKLDGALSAAGKCWGADETGQSFEKDYLPNATDVQEMFESVAKNIEEMKAGIDRMAGTLGDAEDATGGA
jgi:uncharacterized protein YukE